MSIKQKLIQKARANHFMSYLQAEYSKKYQEEKDNESIEKEYSQAISEMSRGIEYIEDNISSMTPEDAIIYMKDLGYKVEDCEKELEQANLGIERLKKYLNRGK